MRSSLTRWPASRRGTTYAHLRQKTDVFKRQDPEPKPPAATTSHGFSQVRVQPPATSKLASTTHSLSRPAAKAPPDHFRKRELLRIRQENARLAGKLIDLKSTGSSLSKDRLQRDLPKLSNKTATSRILADPYSHDIVPSKFGLLKFPEGFKKRAMQGFQFKKVLDPDADAQQRAPRPSRSDGQPAQAEAGRVPGEEKKNLPHIEHP